MGWIRETVLVILAVAFPALAIAGEKPVEGPGTKKDPVGQPAPQKHAAQLTTTEREVLEHLELLENLELLEKMDVVRDLKLLRGEGGGR